jgi:hypothetical protein
MATGSKRARGLKKAKLTRDDHARHVMITRESRWESQRLFFSYHPDLTLFVHSWRPVLHYIKAILQGDTYGEVSEDPMIRDFDPMAGNQPETLKSARRSKIELKPIL